jgi:hypothetical protein
MQLNRSDGKRYLDRWGVRTPWFGIYLHKMTAGDPGIDLHDHPWLLKSFILKGGYIETRANIRDHMAYGARTGNVVHKALTWNRIDLDECHTIDELLAPVTWTLAFSGPVRRRWGFYVPADIADQRGPDHHMDWIYYEDYDQTRQRGLSYGVQRGQTK